MRGLGLRGAPVVHVTLVRTLRRASHTGITLHCTTTLRPQEQTRKHGLPLTSVARTVIDLFPGPNPTARGHLLDEALKRTSITTG